MNTFTVLGIMSGTSLDGIDLALVHFSKKNHRWNFTIKAANTVAYSIEWVRKLSFVKNGVEISSSEFFELEAAYSKLLVAEIAAFLKSHNIAKNQVDFIASHGHTLHHNPKLGYTTQIGSGAILSALSGIDCYSDFRTADVALGGQGAPLVPIGDKLLFNNFEACLNLGGFANISFMKKDVPLAFDVCPLNTVLNRYAEKLHKPYDDGGKLAKSGVVNQELLNLLSSIPYYAQAPPKSLGEEWVKEVFIHMLNDFNDTPQNMLATLTQHMALQICAILQEYKPKNMCITGGGAYNSYLIDLIKQQSQLEVMLPDTTIIEFKEALIFAFLGVLANQGEDNVLSSITGAHINHCAGSFHRAPKA